MGLFDFLWGSPNKTKNNMKNTKNEKNKATKKVIERIKQDGKFAFLYNDIENYKEYHIRCKIDKVRISNDGNLIATSSSGEPLQFRDSWELQDFYDDGPHRFVALRIWEYGTFKILKEFCNMDILDIKFSADSKFFAMAFKNKDECGGNYCSKENHIDIINTENLCVICSLTLAESQSCLGIAISNNFDYIAIRIYDEKSHEHFVRIIDINTSNQVREINMESNKKYFYVSTIMEFSYDDEFLIISLDEEKGARLSELQIIDIINEKVKSKVNTVTLDGVDIGNVSNKIVYPYTEYEDKLIRINELGQRISKRISKYGYCVMDMNTNDIIKTSNGEDYECDGFEIAKFNLNDEKIIVKGGYVNSSVKDDYMKSKDSIRGCISLFDVKELKHIKTIDLNELQDIQAKEIIRFDINRYDELLVYSSDYNVYNLLCFNLDYSEKIFTNKIFSTSGMAELERSDYCREKEVLVSNQYYFGSYDRTVVFSTYKEFTDNIQKMSRQYRDDEKYAQFNSNSNSWVCCIEELNERAANYNSNGESQSLYSNGYHSKVDYNNIDLGESYDDYYENLNYVDSDDEI